MKQLISFMIYDTTDAVYQYLFNFHTRAHALIRIASTAVQQI